jgi:chloramphenicol-sensitive protein RarD
MDSPASNPEPAAMTDSRKATRRGFAAALGAFAIWGVFPLYLRPLAHVSPMQIMAHRIVWSFLLVFAWLAWRGDLAAVRTALRDRPVRMLLATSSVMISINWLTYLWAVANGHVIDASLGYFINPLLNVVLGVMLLRERLNRPQWIAVGLAGLGVAYMTLVTGRLPWIALVLAASFGLYGLIRKLVKVEAVPGLAIETLLLVPFATAFLLWAEWTGVGALGHDSTLTNLLLLGTGIATAVPLALFAVGSRLLPLSTLGVVQYVGPTIQFLVGVFVFHEPFTHARVVGFSCIWVALAIYMIDGLRRNHAALRLRIAT